MKIIAAIVVVLVPVCSHAQTVPDTIYQVEITATASPMVNFFRLPRVPDSDSKTSLGAGVSVRAVWHPARLLSIGVMTGYFVLAQDEIAVRQPSGNLTYTARLAAVPLLLALTMQKYNVEVGVGIGPYLMMTTIEGGNSAAVQATRFELGMTFFGTYFFSLADNILIGPELRVLSFRYRGIISIMPSCSFRINTLRY